MYNFDGIFPQLQQRARHGETPSEMLRWLTAQPIGANASFTAAVFCKAFDIGNAKLSIVRGWSSNGHGEISDAQLDAELAPVIEATRNRWDRVSETPLSLALKSVATLPGLKVINGEVRGVKFTKRISEASLQTMLRIFNDSKMEFCFYDALYPSMSDPGAYFSYSSIDAGQGVWRMTFGNHGWSGGIYEIAVQTLGIQILDLIAKKLLTSINVDKVHFSSHYQLESASKNKDMNKKLLTIHQNPMWA